MNKKCLGGEREGTTDTLLKLGATKTPGANGGRRGVSLTGVCVALFQIFYVGK